MPGINSATTIAALIGEPARMSMLVALMEGRWLSAGELRDAAGVTGATASGHLSRLLDGGLVRAHRQGRHRYFQLSGADVARMIEQLMAVGGELDARRSARPVMTGPRDPGLRFARICYDHLAGALAVAIAERMQAAGELRIDVDGASLTPEGMSLVESLGIALPPQAGSRSCRPCLDWSVRRPHIGGALGQLMFDRFVEQSWIARRDGTREVTVTPKGRAALERLFGVRFDNALSGPPLAGTPARSPENYGRNGLRPPEIEAQP